MKKLIAILTVALLSGCAGLSEIDKAEKAALKEYQKAGATVARKEVKLTAATAASVAATANVFKATGELTKAKKAEADAYNKLNEILKKDKEEEKK